MQRRAALTAAATTSLAAIAVTTGIAVNLGILRSGTEGAGDLALAAEKSPAATVTTGQRAARIPRTILTAPTQPEAVTEYLTYYQDIPAPAATPAGVPAEGPAESPDPEPSPATGPSGNDEPSHGDGDEDHDGDDSDGLPTTGAPVATSPTTRPTAPPTTPAPSSVITYNAGDAGTVTADIRGDTMSIVSTSPANGWTARIERSSGQEVKVKFDGPGGEVKWKAHVENGRVDVEIEYENEGDD